MIFVIRFSEFFSALSDHIPSGHHGDRPQLTLAVVDGDSTSVYYHITHGVQTANNKDTIKKFTR